MNVDTMRKIDYFAGVPLCFSATLLEKLVRLIRPGRQSRCSTPGAYYPFGTINFVFPTFHFHCLVITLKGFFHRQVGIGHLVIRKNL
jgi:hypothetical protein